MPVELASELLSGPDLGGGYLFQLTRDRAPYPVGFTFHLQPAGSDAGETPPGSPELLGYSHPASPCMYGGTQCWHRFFDLDPGEGSRVRVAYNRTRFVIGEMLAQAAHARPAPLAEALRELLARIARPLAEAAVPWQIGGSTAAWLRGVPLAPADIDVGIAAPEAARLEHLVEEYVVEPLHLEVESDGGQRSHGAAFVGTLRSGVRVEWGGMQTMPTVDGRPMEWGGPRWVERRSVVPFDGFQVPLSPLEFTLLRAAQRGQEERLEALMIYLNEHGTDRELLGAILPGSGVPARLEARIRSRLGL